MHTTKNDTFGIAQPRPISLFATRPTRIVSALATPLALTLAMACPALAAAPTVASVTAGPVGAAITITGDNFTDNNHTVNSVVFNTIAGTVAAVPFNVTNTSLQVLVPGGAINGTVRLLDGEGVGTGQFTRGVQVTRVEVLSQDLIGGVLYPRLRITGSGFFDDAGTASRVSRATFSALGGIAGSLVTVQGTNLNALSDTTLEATVPLGVLSGYTIRSANVFVAGVNEPGSLLNINLPLAPGGSAGVAGIATPGIVVTAGALPLMTSEDGTSTTVKIRLNTPVGVPVQIKLTSSSPGEVSVSPAVITLEPGQTEATVTLTGVNDDAVDGSQPVTISATVTSGDGNYNGIPVVPIEVINTDNDQAGITVTPTAGLVTGEAGQPASFVVALNKAPVAPVTIPISISDSSEGTVSTSALTFTPLSYGPQTVTVTGADDMVADGDVAYTVVVGASQSLSAAYNGIDAPDVSLLNSDNDIVGVIVSAQSLSMAEGGASTFTVRLSSQPTSPVTINVSSSDPSEGTASPSTLTFDASNYATPQTVTVSGVEDALADGMVSYSIGLGSASSDGAYNGLSLPPIAATSTDNDTAGIIVDAHEIRVTEGEIVDTFTVHLSSQPTSEVTLPLSVDKPGQVLLSAPALTFTPENWNVPQTVTITAPETATATGSQPFSITTGPSQSADAPYNGLKPAANVTGTVLDNDTASIVITPRTLSLGEGETGTFNIQLTSEPLAPVTFGFQPSIPGQVTMPVTVVLNAQNWRDGVNVPVTVLRDGTADGAGSITIQSTGTTSADPAYVQSGGALPSITVAMTDADSVLARVIVSSTALTTVEGGADAAFMVHLGAKPVGNVLVRLRTTDLTEGKLSSEALMFTPQNFAQPQQVRVMSVDDRIEDGDIPHTIVTVAEAPNTVYHGMTGDLITVVNRDNDDLTLPVVAVENPAPLRTYRVLPIIGGTASDVQGVNVPSGAQRVDVRLTRAGTSLYMQANGTFAATLSTLSAPINALGAWGVRLPRALEAGRYSLSATCYDRAGNASRPQVTPFTIAGGPIVLSIDSPFDKRYANERAYIRGTVSLLPTNANLRTLRVSIKRGSTVVKVMPAIVRGNTFFTAAIGRLPQGNYTFEAVATDAQNRTLTDAVTVFFDETPPTSVAITSPTPNQKLSNITLVTGTVRDVLGGSPLDRVELIIKRRSDSFFFNGRAFQKLPASVRVTISGTNWVYRLPAGLPLQPNAFNATYGLQAVAADGAANGKASSVVYTILNPTVAPTPAPRHAAIVFSPVMLSVTQASAQAVVLRFSSVLSAEGAAQGRYKLLLNGALVEVEAVATRGNELLLTIPEGEAQPGDSVQLAYELLDTQSRVMRGNATAIVR